MAQYRYIKMQLWDDAWVAELSDAAFRLFMYCLTNRDTSLSGFYEKPVTVIAASIGKSPKETQALFSQLSPKVLYLDGWVCIKNYAKHQSVSDNPKVQAFIEKDMERVPPEIVQRANDAFYTQSLLSPIPKPVPTPKPKSMDRVSLPYSEQFERVWAIYPRKVGKGAAWKAWQVLQPSPQLAELIISKVGVYKSTVQWKKDGGQFVPHLATFLNQRRFDDEPESTSTPTSSKYGNL